MDRPKIVGNVWRIEHDGIRIDQMGKRRFRFSTRGSAAGDTGVTLAARKPRLLSPVLVGLPRMLMEVTAADVVMERQRPPMHLRDEIIFLLHTAAEIEHSLMIQYLFSAYSLPDSSPHNEWREVVVDIAREEMGHLMAVQNMLLAMGGPLNFQREDFPLNDLYPFPFSLEPFSVKTMAKYVLAEMPKEDEIPASIGFDLDAVRADAEVTGSGDEVQRVGALFGLLVELVQQLGPEDIFDDSLVFQADPGDWLASIYDLKLRTVTNKDEMSNLLEEIADQGEGPLEPQAGQKSHFRRFFDLYKAAKEHAASHGEPSLANAVPDNPTVHLDDSDGFLSHPESNAWGDIFNHRFRWLFALLAHYLATNSAHTTTRGKTCEWAFEEMYHLREIAGIFQQLPQHDPLQIDEHGRPCLAATPFELPYTLNIPSQPIDKWRYHELMALHSLDQLSRVPRSQSLVDNLKATDTARLAIIQQIQEEFA